MERSMMIEAFAMPRGKPGGLPAVHVTVMHGFAAHHLRLSLEQAEDAHARLGTAIGALRLGEALGRGDDPRDAERIKRAKLAIRIGLDSAGVCAVFDLTAADYERLATEVAG